MKAPDAREEEIKMFVRGGAAMLRGQAARRGVSRGVAEEKEFEIHARESNGSVWNIA